MTEENPFTEQAEELEQFCWRDGARHCGSDCTAYDDRCEADPVWSPCLLLNLQRAQAKSHANIAAELKRQNDFYEARQETTDKKAQAEAYAKKVQEMDKPPPKIT